MAEEIAGDAKADLSFDSIVDTLADKYWRQSKPDQRPAFDGTIIKNLYINHIQGSNFHPKRILALELSQYLECYLWPNYGPQTTTLEYVMSIVLMVNQKFRERVAAWETFKNNPEHFAELFKQLTRIIVENKENLNWNERTALVMFLNHCINSIETDLIREQVQKYFSLSIWTNLSEKRRESEFKQMVKLRKFWKALEKKDSKLDANSLAQATFERRFMAEIIADFFNVLNYVPLPDKVPRLNREGQSIVKYCERFMEMLIDIEALLPTRRFFNALLDDMRVIVNCRKSNISRRHDEGKLFNQLLDMLVFYARFEIDDQAGEALTDQEMIARHYDKMVELQKLAWKNFPEKLRKFCLSNIANIDNRDALVNHFGALPDETLKQFCDMVGIVLGEDNFDRELALEMIVFVYEKVNSQLQALNEIPLYPTEMIVWDENIVPNEYVGADTCLALPKLNLQFLTLHDYLLRNFHLFRLESTYEIRQDIEDAVFRMKPYKAEDGGCIFGGWARMALVIDHFQIVEIKKPKIGEGHPSKVRAEVRVNLNVRKEAKREWESLRKHDVCFLITVRPNLKPGTPFKFKEPFLPQVGLHYVRGCEVEGMLDANGKLLDETSRERPNFDTDYRTYRVWLDPNQFSADTESHRNGNEDVYETFNILVRRKPKENNFKAVLETIRDLMNTKCVVPEWLHDVILGYGDPSAAHYSNLPNPLRTLDFNDTFLDFEHVKESFSGINLQTQTSTDKLVPPFKLKIVDDANIMVEPYIIPNRGPYPFERPKTNTVRFTPTQVEAIKSGMNSGLTLVVGPPGTGKTDVAVQIISNIYHNFPEQRTLIVTHSNQALNQIFEKIMALDIDERHLLRMGHGEEELETEKDFSRYGRVNYVLTKRLELLERVQRLAESLGIGIDAGYTCETAGYFFLYHIFARWEEYMSKLGAKAVQDVANFFPFVKFFEDAPQPLFKGRSFDEDLEIAKGCYRHIKKIFTQLDHFKAFEMLRTGSERSRYLLVKEAKIIAMTCTHAALKRKELVEIGFQYDNILMEESAQILEIETFIPLLLQNPEHGHNRLKRWIMIGDHHQLPPVIKNMAFQKYSNMEQSLFARVVRLGVPTVDLDAQGRSRPSLCSLFRWRYKNLNDLPHVVGQPEFQLANAGFAHEYQLINVENFNGVGESEPVPHFYQNLAEAEYMVALFMYMRLLGYPAEKITMLTTYNGQKHLLRDVVRQRCASNPFIGQPHKITTVDKFQGQQNDYILLSLVRTKTVGHLRDVRRLVVALSRARLGLYIFARASNFANCFELAHSFKLLSNYGHQLALLPSENYPTKRKSNDQLPEKPRVFEQMQDMVQWVYEFYAHKMEQWQKERPQLFEQFNEPPAEEEPAEPMEQQETTTITEQGGGDEEDLGFEKLTEDDTGMADQQEIEPIQED